MKLRAKCEIGFMKDEITEVIAYLHTGEEVDVFPTDEGMKFEFLGKQYSVYDFPDKFELIGDWILDLFEVNMFKVIDMCGNVDIAYGTFIDEDGNIQFILCDSDGEFYKTNKCKGFYKLYDVTTMQ